MKERVNNVSKKSTIVNMAELAELARRAKGKIHHIYLHWTAGRYEQVFDEYHISIGRDGTIFLTCEELYEVKAHTWRRNTGAVGLTLCCAYQAVAGNPKGDAIPWIDFGPYAPTQMQIETMAKVIAVITKEMGLDINEETVLTHQEAATLDGYGPGSGDPETRWDLWYLPNLPITERLVQGGRVLRGKAIWYRYQLENN